MPFLEHASQALSSSNSPADCASIDDDCRKLQAQDCCAQVFLNPSAELPDMPLKSFYRYALPDFPPASSSNAHTLGMPGPPAATFAGLPARKVCIRMKC